MWARMYVCMYVCMYVPFLSSDLIHLKTKDRSLDLCVCVWWGGGGGGGGGARVRACLRAYVCVYVLKPC